MNNLLFLEAIKPGEIILVLVFIFAIPFGCFFVGYKWGYYKGKDAERKENKDKN